jgi:hypothetical protein
MSKKHQPQIVDRYVIDVYKTLYGLDNIPTDIEELKKVNLDIIQHKIPQYHESIFENEENVIKTHGKTMREWCFLGKSELDLTKPLPRNLHTAFYQSDAPVTDKGDYSVAVAYTLKEPTNPNVHDVKLTEKFKNLFNELDWEHFAVDKVFESEVKEPELIENQKLESIKIHKLFCDERYSYFGIVPSGFAIEKLNKEYITEKIPERARQFFSNDKYVLFEHKKYISKRQPSLVCYAILYTYDFFKKEEKLGWLNLVWFQEEDENPIKKCKEIANKINWHTEGEKGEF